MSQRFLYCAGIHLASLALLGALAIVAFGIRALIRFFAGGGSL